MSENLLEFPDNHSPHAYQLLHEDPLFEAFIADAAKTIVNLHVTTRNLGKLPVERWRLESPFQQFHADILERYEKNLPPEGRLRDAYLAAAKYADENEGRWTIYFVPGVTKKAMKVKGTVITDGIPGYKELHIDAGVEALFGHVDIPDVDHYCMDVIALLFQIQNPFERDVPVLDWVTKEGSRVHLSARGASYSGWPVVRCIGGSKQCCVNQLLGLLQFPVIPRHPQLQKEKYINWGYNRQGLFRTLTYRQEKVVACTCVDISSSSDSDSD